MLSWWLGRAQEPSGSWGEGLAATGNGGKVCDWLSAPREEATTSLGDHLHPLPLGQPPHPDPKFPTQSTQLDRGTTQPLLQQLSAHSLASYGWSWGQAPSCLVSPMSLSMCSWRGAWQPPAHSADGIAEAEGGQLGTIHRCHIRGCKPGLFWCPHAGRKVGVAGAGWFQDLPACLLPQKP